MDIEGFGGAGVRIEASNVTIGALPDRHAAVHVPLQHVQGQRQGRGRRRERDAEPDRGQPDAEQRRGRRSTSAPTAARRTTPSDADTGADGLHNFPIGVLSERDPVSNVLKVSGVDVPADAGEAIDIYAQSAADAAKGAEPTDYVGSTTVGYMGGWSFDVPASVPANDTFFSATVTTAADGTSELSPICTDPDGDGNPDSDGDGLCDTWETTGIDADDDGKVDLTLPGASPHAQGPLRRDGRDGRRREHDPPRTARSRTSSTPSRTRR